MTDYNNQIGNHTVFWNAYTYTYSAKVTLADFCVIFHRHYAITACHYYIEP